jgi:ABC-type sugar transport system ATPase subunit
MNLIAAEINREGDTTMITCGEGRSELPKDKAWMLERLVGREALLGIRPEHITMTTTTGAGTLKGKIENIEPLGRELLYHVHTRVGTLIVLSSEQELQVEDTVHLFFNPTHIHLFQPEDD